MGAEDKIRNELDDATGQLKEGAGKATGDESLEAEGRLDQAGAHARKAGEKVKDAAANVRESANRALGRDS